MAICLDAYFNLKLFPILAILAILWAHVVNALVSVEMRKLEVLVVV
jgi:hypothetical protein